MHGSIQRGQSPSNGGGHSRGPKAHARGAHSQGEKGRAALMLSVHTPAPKSICLGSQKRPTPPSGKPPHWASSREHPLGRHPLPGSGPSSQPSKGGTILTSFQRWRNQGPERFGSPTRWHGLRGPGRLDGTWAYVQPPHPLTPTPPIWPQTRFSETSCPSLRSGCGAIFGDSNRQKNQTPGRSRNIDCFWREGGQAGAQARGFSSLAPRQAQAKAGQAAQTRPGGPGASLQACGGASMEKPSVHPSVCPPPALTARRDLELPS